MRTEPVQVIHDLILQVVEESVKFRILVLVADLLDVIVDDGENELVDEFFQRILRLAVDVAHLTHDKFHRALQRRPVSDHLIDLFLCQSTLLDEAFELVKADRLIIDDRGDIRPYNRTDLDLNDFKSLFLYLLLKVFQNASLPVLKMFEKAFAFFLEPLALKNSRDALQEFLKECVKIVPEFVPFPCRHGDESCLIDILEIVEITLILELHLLPLDLGKETFDGCHTPCPGISCDEDIVPRVLYLKSELEGVKRAFLPDDVF